MSQPDHLVLYRHEFVLLSLGIIAGYIGKYLLFLNSTIGVMIMLIGIYFLYLAFG